ncbi:hypothetical protein ASZ90_001970 [hydrocarbon metagenome]|uniref:Uncharacterized protein n=1 Tax=hydrocarbon metagenome TaxID=938273 RepID=A0A0W8G4T5_9ZZZZ
MKGRGDTSPAAPKGFTYFPRPVLSMVRLPPPGRRRPAPPSGSWAPKGPSGRRPASASVTMFFIPVHFLKK